jgi:hypothetical protein
LTHAYLGLVALDLVLLAVGYGALTALGFVRTGRRLLPYAGLAFIAGWAVMGVVLSLAVMVGVDPTVVHVLLLAGLVLVACRLARRRVPPLEPAAALPRPGWLGRAVALLGGGLLVLTMLVAVAETARSRADMSWDAWIFWLPKAKALYYFHGLDTGLSGYTTYWHVDYPPLVPVMDAASFHFMDGVYPMLVPLQRGLLAAGFVGAAAVILLRRVPAWIALPSLAMLMLAPHVWTGMFTVLPDQPLSYLLALAALAGVLWLDEGRPAWLVLAFALLSAAALTKVEGVVFGGMLAAIVAAASCVSRGRRGRLALVLLLAPCVIVPWRIWLAAHGYSGSSTDYAVSDLLDPGYLADRVGNLRLATHNMLERLFDDPVWTPILPLTLAVAVVLAYSLRVVSVVLLTWLVVTFAAIATVYWIGKPEIHWYLSTSVDRVVSVLPFVSGTLLPLLLGLALGREAATAAQRVPKAPRGSWARRWVERRPASGEGAAASAE